MSETIHSIHLRTKTCPGQIRIVIKLHAHFHRPWGIAWQTQIIAQNSEVHEGSHCLNRFPQIARRPDTALISDGLVEIVEHHQVIGYTGVNVYEGQVYGRFRIARSGGLESGIDYVGSAERSGRTDGSRPNAYPRNPFDTQSPAVNTTVLRPRRDGRRLEADISQSRRILDVRAGRVGDAE